MGYDYDFNIFPIRDGLDFICCPNNGSRIKEGVCSEEELCPGYDEKCPEPKYKRNNNKNF